MREVIYTENKMEYVNGEPKLVKQEFPAMLEGVQGDGSAIIYIDTIPYRVLAKKLRFKNGDPVTK